MAYASFFLDGFPPNDRTSLELDGLKVSGKGESDDMPRAVFPDRSALVRNDERMEPVCGHNTLKDPPPPFGVTTDAGLVVVTQTIDFDIDGIIEVLKKWRLASFFVFVFLHWFSTSRTTG